MKFKKSLKALRGGGTVVEKTKMEEQRRKLNARITSFQSSAENFYALTSTDQPADEADDDDGEDSNDPFEDPDADEEEACVTRPENVKLKLPSLVIRTINKPSPEIRKLATQEIQLRKGQANDALSDLRVKLGYKALLFREEIRKVRGYDNRTRAWDDVNKSQGKVDESVDIYRLARSSMVQLGASSKLLKVYQELKNEDLVIPEDIYNANRTNQKDDKMAWFWRVAGQPIQGEEKDTWMRECK